MTDRLNLLLQDKNIVRLTITLVAVSILVPGILKIGPPQWLHSPSTMPEMTNSDSPRNDILAVSPAATEAKSTVTDDESVTEAKPSVTASTAKPDDENGDIAKAQSENMRGENVGVEVAGGATVADTPTAPKTETTAPTSAVTTPEKTAPEKTVPEKTAPEKTVTPKDETKVAANVQLPRQSIIETLKKPKPSAPRTKLPPVAVARNFVRVIPPTHAALATPQQKEQFIKIVLPLILASNEEIIQRRAAIRRAYDRQDAITLGKWAKLYKLPPENLVSKGFLNDLLARADVIPVPLALAQAAIESGWGTSRFARQGNALFGQWAWQEDVGIKPLNASNKNAVVRSFPNLLGSVRAYMHNLNTHQAYQDLRDSRKRLAKMPKEDKANVLVNHLHNYAEIGMQYVKDLKIVMRKNNMRHYANAFLS